MAINPFDIFSRWTGGGSQTTVQPGPSQNMGPFQQNPLFSQLGSLMQEGFDFKKRLSEEKLIEMQRQAKLQEAEARMRQEAQQQQQGMAHERYLNEKGAMDYARNNPRQDPNAQGTPTFVKGIGGPNMVSGNVRAYAGDPGAVFGGYMPAGAQGPGQSSYQMSPAAGSQHMDPFAGDNYFNADYGAKKDNPEESMQAKALRSYGAKSGY